MGQTLSEPVTAKETSKCANKMFKVGSSCMQGWRINMEDSHTHILSLPGDKDACFFAVFDGHGGEKVAHYAGSHLHKRIVSHHSYGDGNIEEAIRNSFLLLDEDMMNDDELKDDLAGSTANVVLVKNNKIYCGNVGDSRAIASVRGRVEELSHDHKPSNEMESKRITAAGGWVEFNRVNGNLALSRALGDFVFKKNDSKRPEEQIVTAFPDVVVREITQDHEFIVLACDGIWDVLTNQEVVDFVRTRLAQKMEPELLCGIKPFLWYAQWFGGPLLRTAPEQWDLYLPAAVPDLSFWHVEICEELMTRCLAPDCQMGGLGCDNMTVILVCFLHGNDYKNLCDRCARNRSSGHHPQLGSNSSCDLK